MYKPHICYFIKNEGGFDINRNPIPSKNIESDRFACFFDQELPSSVVVNSDGQSAKTPSGVVFIARSNIAKMKFSLKAGLKILIYSKKTKQPLFEGVVKSFSTEDLFHVRIWV